MSLLHVLQEGGGPLEGGGLVGLCVAERDQEVQLVTTDADPAPAGKVEASHRADDTKQSSQASLCHSRDHSSGAQPECQDVSAPLKDCPNPLLTGQKPVSRPRIGSNPPESGAKPCVCGFVVSVKLMTGPHVPRTQSPPGGPASAARGSRSNGPQAASPLHPEAAFSELIYTTTGVSGQNTFNFHTSRLATCRVLYTPTLND